MCIWATKRGSETRRKFDKRASESDLGSCSEIIFFFKDFNGHVEKCVEGFEAVHWKMESKRKYGIKKIAGALR